MRDPIRTSLDFIAAARKREPMLGSERGRNERVRSTPRGV
jgi:hypothetical protein